MHAERFTRFSRRGLVLGRRAMKFFEPAICAFLLLVMGLAATTQPVFAQATIFKTRRSASSVTLPLALGTGLEYESDSEHTQLDLPFFVQYSFSPVLQATVQTAGTRIKTKGDSPSSVTGLDDLETSVEYEFLRERRNRPSLTAFGGAKWPTATKSEIGNPGADFAAGLIATKEFDRFEVDMNAIYTLSGGGRRDFLELPIAVEVPINHRFSVAAEFSPTIDMRGSGEGTGQIEYTLGGLWRSTNFQTIEGGVVRRNDGSWQVVVGWQFSFAGD